VLEPIGAVLAGAVSAVSGVGVIGLLGTYIRSDRGA